jgi:hypothetical protein
MFTAFMKHCNMSMLVLEINPKTSLDKELFKRFWAVSAFNIDSESISQLHSIIKVFRLNVFPIF